MHSPENVCKQMEKGCDSQRKTGIRDRRVKKDGNSDLWISDMLLNSFLYFFEKKMLPFFFFLICGKFIIPYIE